MNTTTYRKKDEEEVVNAQPTQTTTYKTITPIQKAEPQKTETNPVTNATPVQNVVPTAASVENSLSQQAAAKSFSYNGTKPTYASPYSEKIDQLFNEIQNNPEFVFDPEKDTSYQALKGQYTQLGQQAMKDTTAQIAAQTGGIASSYAASAGSQAYNNYMNELAGFIPELQQLAYEMYQGDLNRKYQQLDALNMLENNAYGQYRDQMSDYYTDYNMAYDQFLNELAQENWQKEFDSNEYWNRVNQSNWESEMSYKQMLAAMEQANWQAQFDYNAQQDAINRQDKLDALAYEKEQAAIDRAWEEALTKADLGDFSGLESLGFDTSSIYNEMKKAEEKAAYDKAWEEAKTKAEYGDYSGLAGLGVDTSAIYEEMRKADEKERLDREEDEYKRIWNEAITMAEFGDYSGLNALGIDTSMISSELEKANAEAEYDRLKKDAEWRASYGDYSGMENLGFDMSAYYTPEQTHNKRVEEARELLANGTITHDQFAARVGNYYDEFKASSTPMADIDPYSEEVLTTFIKDYTTKRSTSGTFVSEKTESEAYLQLDNDLMAGNIDSKQYSILKGMLDELYANKYEVRDKASTAKATLK